jgi:GNAT superfamily N-acetyltransferase
MLEPDEQLSEEEVARIAALHVESIDDSLPALLGPAFARRLYRFLSTSDRELLLVERVAGRPESACVVSFAPGSLHGRILRATLPVLVWRSLVGLLASAAFRRFLAHAVADALRGEGSPEQAPEITYVFTNRELRGKRLGQRLVARVDRALGERGVDRYFVKTLDEPTNRALRFYEENGFERRVPQNPRAAITSCSGEEPTCSRCPASASTRAPATTGRSPGRS